MDNCLNDDSDIMREVKNLFMRSNLLCRRFRRCSLQIKLVLFRYFCICFYDTGIWSHFSAVALLKCKSRYHECLKYFFGYLRYRLQQCHKYVSLICCLVLVFLLLKH